MVERIRGLKRDHRAARHQLDAIATIVRRWLSNDAIEAEDVRDLRAALKVLTTLYAQHLAFEDRDLLPLAKRLLSPGQIREIRDEMVARRTVGEHPQIP
jgi:hemerythrin-like domain-containing protein